MFTKRISAVAALVLACSLYGHTVRAQTSALEAALGDLYAICLFEKVPNNPFGQAADIARGSLAPGISGFIESSLAAIPVTPPSLDAQFISGQVVNVVSGFTPIFTESASTVGKGQWLVGSNASHFNLSQIRGTDLDELEFQFWQNEGSDYVLVNMPFDVDASLLTLFGSYGISDRLDIGVALPIVRLTISNVNTSFSVVGDETGCRYAPGDLNCQGRGNRGVSIPLNNFEDNLSETETYLSTLAVRAKYRFPSASTQRTVAAVVDMRLPIGRDDGSSLGSGNFGTRITLIGEYEASDSFKPYANLGAQFWNGNDTNSLRIAAGFTQQVMSKVFFAFDLLSEIEIEDPTFMTGIQNQDLGDGSGDLPIVRFSSIPSVTRDHTLNAGLGLKIALTPGFQFYGSAMLPLLDRGLQSSVVPTIGFSWYL
jgi:hypothetical protein